MVRSAFKALIADVVLLTLLFFVLNDLQTRAAFAASPHNVCGGLCSYSPSFSYGLLTQFFTMTGNGVRLVSPPTLDWVQLLSLALVVVNVWFAYAFFVKRREAKVRRELERRQTT